MIGSTWMPTGTLSPALDCDLAALASEWADTWFGRPLAVRDGMAHREALYVRGDAVAIGLTGEDPGVLALGRRFAGARSAGDRALLDRVGAAAREDAQRRVANTLACDGDWVGPVDRLAWPAARVLRFGDAQGQLSLTIHLGPQCLAAAILARLPAVVPPERPLTSLSGALAGRGIRLSARLGRCTLRLAEMREMVVGDTLLFDRAVEDALPVVVEDTAATIATARVVREPARWMLQLVTSRMGKAA